MITITDLNTLEPDLNSDHPTGWYRGPNGYTMQLNHGKPLNFTAVIEFLPGQPRGNHYHLLREEYLTVLSGEMVAKFWHPDDLDTLECVTLTPGIQVCIPSGTAHVYEATVPTVAVEQAEQCYKISDTYSCC